MQGVLAPVRYSIHGVEELFCDGGLICNYPIHVFDGESEGRAYCSNNLHKMLSFPLLSISVRQMADTG